MKAIEKNYYCNEDDRHHSTHPTPQSEIEAFLASRKTIECASLRAQLTLEKCKVNQARSFFVCGDCTQADRAPAPTAEERKKILDATGKAKKPLRVVAKREEQAEKPQRPVAEKPSHRICVGQGCNGIAEPGCNVCSACRQEIIDTNRPRPAAHKPAPKPRPERADGVRCTVTGCTEFAEKGKLVCRICSADGEAVVEETVKVMPKTRKLSGKRAAKAPAAKPVREPPRKSKREICPTCGRGTARMVTPEKCWRCNASLGKSIPIAATPGNRGGGDSMPASDLVKPDFRARAARRAELYRQCMQICRETLT